MSVSAPSETPGRIPLPLIRLAVLPEGNAEATTAQLQFSVGGQPINMELTVPAGLTPLRNVLPLFQGLTNTIVDLAIAKEQQQGKQVSCKAGCGACCRQLVPVSPAEAHALARLVAAMPEPRRSTIKDRFAAVRERIAAAGLLELLRHPGQMNVGQRRTLGLDYSRLRIACPFLEEESCSIYSDRPLVCREYLVTSPAEACGQQDFEHIAPVVLPTEVANALRAVDWQTTGTPDAWVPLSLSLDWATGQTAEPVLPGPAWIERVFNHLANKPVGMSAQKQEAAGITKLLQTLFAPGVEARQVISFFLHPEIHVLELDRGQARYLPAAMWATQQARAGTEGGSVDILGLEQMTPTLVSAYVICRQGPQRTNAACTLVADQGIWKIAAMVLEHQTGS